jgi:HAD superfamily hydrolase (TIGR01509 family)
MSDRCVLLFDLGGVLVHSSGHIGSSEIRERWAGSSAVRLFESGKMSAEKFASTFVSEWQLPLQPHEFLTEFSSWVKGFYPGAELLLQRLRQRHLVACLSNTNEIHWQSLSEALTSFDICVASHVIGFMKPDLESYQAALDELGASADCVYFFDDLLPNVLAARSLGISAHQVCGLTEVEATLKALGLS